MIQDKRHTAPSGLLVLLALLALLVIDIAVVVLDIVRNAASRG